MNCNDQQRSARRAMAADIIASAQNTCTSACSYFDNCMYPAAVRQQQEGDPCRVVNAWGAYDMTDVIKRGALVAADIDAIGATSPEQIEP